MSREGSTPAVSKTMFALVGSVVLSGLLIASLILFLDRPNHRIAGVAWNALFQFFGPLIGLGYAAWVGVLALARKIDQRIGLCAAMLLAATSAYCLYRAIPIMLSV